MILYPDIQILLLLWLANFTPPLLAFFLEDRFNAPIDCGRLYQDDKPLFGPHKTWRGLFGALLAGSLLALALGFPVWLGFSAALLSMGGDLVSSFIKRRLNRPSGNNFPVLDQFFEGFFPFLVFIPYFQIGLTRALVLTVMFCIGAYFGSVFYKRILLQEPFPWYPRDLKAKTRFKEISSCSPQFKHLQPVVHFEEAIYYHRIIKFFFTATGLFEQGRKNALDIKLVNRLVTLPRLPEAFYNYNVIYFSDLHIDGLKELLPAVSRILERESPDLCIFGGDLRMSSYGDYRECLDLFAVIVSKISSRHGIYAVLGNHDCLEMVPEMEKIGVRVLLNDSAEITQNGQSIYLIGVDDPHYYNCANVEMASQNVPEDSFKIFLCHSPEMFSQAAEKGMDLYLCGHTHAGQVQLPKIGPVFTHSRSPRFMAQGFWKLGDMQGYTSSGAGVSGVPVRFLTRGEIVSLTLMK